MIVQLICVKSGPWSTHVEQTLYLSCLTFSNSYSISQKYTHGFVVVCFVVVMQSFIMNSHEVFIHIHQGCYAGTGAIVRLPQCQWSKPDGYGKISHCITTTKHSKAKTVCIFLGIYCSRSQFTTGSLQCNRLLCTPLQFFAAKELNELEKMQPVWVTNESLFIKMPHDTFKCYLKKYSGRTDCVQWSQQCL